MTTFDVTVVDPGDSETTVARGTKENLLEGVKFVHAASPVGGLTAERCGMIWGMDLPDAAYSGSIATMPLPLAPH